MNFRQQLQEEISKNATLPFNWSTLKSNSGLERRQMWDTRLMIQSFGRRKYIEKCEAYQLWTVR